MDRALGNVKFHAGASKAKDAVGHIVSKRSSIAPKKAERSRRKSMALSKKNGFHVYHIHRSTLLADVITPLIQKTQLAVANGVDFSSIKDASMKLRCNQVLKETFKFCFLRLPMCRTRWVPFATI